MQNKGKRLGLAWAANCFYKVFTIATISGKYNLGEMLLHVVYNIVDCDVIINRINSELTICENNYKDNLRKLSLKDHLSNSVWDDSYNRLSLNHKANVVSILHSGIIEALDRAL